MQDFLQAQGDLENLTRETDSAANDAMVLFEGAQTLSDEVEALKAEATTISIQDITSKLKITIYMFLCDKRPFNSGYQT